MLPHELIAKHIAPKIKLLVIKRLYERGLGQDKIAKLLGLTQPMVSKYLRYREDEVYFLLEESSIREEIEQIVEILSHYLENGDVIGYITTFSHFMNTLLARGSLCDFHRKIDSRSELKTCSICLYLFTPFTDPVIEEVKEALNLLSLEPNAVKLIPNVGSNIVAAKKDARNIMDIVGLSGAIVREGKRLVIVGEPIYGGSRHTASVLLSVMKKWKNKRACIVISYAEDCIEKLRDNGLNVVYSGPHRDSRGLVRELENTIDRSYLPIDVIADRGGIGLEPVVYIFAENALEAVRRSLLCVR